MQIHFFANYFKSQIIEWINYKNNYHSLINTFDKIIGLNKKFIIDFKIYLTKNNDNYKNYILELYILFIINNIHIILFDNFDNIIIVFDNNYLYIQNYTNNNLLNKYNDKNLIKNYIKIKYNIVNFSLTNQPSIIYVIY